MSKEKLSNSRPSFRELNSKLEDFRQKRDDLNKKTKEIIGKLQQIESEIIETLKIAKDKYKKKRDYWNNKVSKLKEKKIEYKDLLDETLSEKKKFRGKGKRPDQRAFGSIRQINQKIENLERIIETENLDMSEENSIIDEIRDLETTKQGFLSEQKNDDFFRLERKIEIIKINMSKIYEKLNKWSDKSQINHQKMHELYQKVNELRDSKKRKEEELIENKKAADGFHEKYLEVMTQRKKINKNRPKKSGEKYNQRQSKHPKKKQNFVSRNRGPRNHLLEKLKKEKLETALEKQKAGKKLNLYEARLILEQHKG